MSSEHFIYMCRDCKIILNQCRCVAPRKTVYYSICSKCVKKAVTAGMVPPAITIEQPSDPLTPEAGWTMEPFSDFQPDFEIDDIALFREAIDAYDGAFSSTSQMSLGIHTIKVQRLKDIVDKFEKLFTENN